MSPRVPLFYTLPPPGIPWPFVLVNANRPGPGLGYLARHAGVVESVIIDSGVEVFRDPGVREYPGGPRRWLDERLVPLYRRVRGLVPGARVYVVANDYPDDYYPGSLWEDWQRTNIERTLDNIVYALERYPDIDWVIPVQGHYEDPGSIVLSLEWLEAVGALEWAMGRTRYLALANLCVSKKCSTIEATVRRARSWLDAHGYRALRLHVFGPAVNCVRRVARLIHSWDSVAWTRPRAPGGSSSWSAAERAYLFLTWLHRYADLIELPPLPRSMRERIGAGRKKSG